jgi:deazaflavin-dependent oxidoreductase (nitroreductase family)
MTEIPPLRPRPKGLMRVLMRAPLVLYRLGLGGLMGKSTVVLTTTGRRSGRPRSTPVNYWEADGVFYVIAGSGTYADWYRNLVAQPEVEVQVGRRRLRAIASPLTDPREKAHALWLFGQHSPGTAERYFGIPRGTAEEDLLSLAEQRAIVAIRPRD